MFLPWFCFGELPPPTLGTIMREPTMEASCPPARGRCGPQASPPSSSSVEEASGLRGKAPNTILKSSSISPFWGQRLGLFCLFHDLALLKAATDGFYCMQPKNADRQRNVSWLTPHRPARSTWLSENFEPKAVWCHSPHATSRKICIEG